jgi:Trk-type K+ transport system membrane component
MVRSFSHDAQTHNALETTTKEVQKLPKNLARKIRDVVGYLEDTLGPYVKKIIPSFLAAHYSYIIGMALLGSIVVYPYKNIDYIDALFMSACSVTQAGLNTIDLNSMKLYQQITFYVICVLTTPIFMHSSLCLIRLFWFERHFDNIQENSKLDFKMRRMTAISARSASRVSCDLPMEEGLNVLATKSSSSLSFELPAEPENDASDQDREGREDIIDPRDLMISIALMRENRESNEETGAPLVVSGPAERSISPLQFDAKNKLQSYTGNITDAVESDGYREEILQRTKSHYQSSSSDLCTGVKFDKRANTMNPDDELNFFRRGRKSHRNQERSDTQEDNSNYSDDMQSRLGRQMSAGYLSWTPTIGRNSAFLNLSDQQREELGGVEYRAVKLLSTILVFYYIGFHILGVIFLVPWILRSSKYQHFVQESGITYTWWGFFTSASSFSDLGFTLTPNSMLSFNDSPFVLLVMAFLIIIGNTGFPVLLRFIIWIMFKLSKDLCQFRESLQFLLDHPRRCFTLLFPSAPTWWLFFILIVFNALDLVIFIALDLNAEVVKDLSTGEKILDGFFQAVSTRTAGFSCIDISQLQPAVQVGYLIMMYISVLPLAISIRRTNVYEEQSLGVYGGDDHGNADRMKPTSLITSHLRKQLSFDMWFIVMGVFIICIAEGSKIKDPLIPAFSIFSVMFEVVSAYGTVGLSLGYPDTNPSLSGQYTTLSKLVIIVMVIRGRHRGLPYSLDRAVMLPSQKMEQIDKEQNNHRVGTMVSGSDPVLEFFKSAAPKAIKDCIKKPSFFTHKSSRSDFPARDSDGSL